MVDNFKESASSRHNHGGVYMNRDYDNSTRPAQAPTRQKSQYKGAGDRHKLAALTKKLPEKKRSVFFSGETLDISTTFHAQEVTPTQIVFCVILVALFFCICFWLFLKRGKKKP